MADLGRFPSSSHALSLSKSDRLQRLHAPEAPLQPEAIWSESRGIEEAEAAVAEEVSEESQLIETLETMSLNLGSRVQDRLSRVDREQAKRHRAARALKKIVAQQPNLEGESQPLEAWMAMESFEAQLQALHQAPLGQQILMVTSLLQRSGGSPESKAAWSEQLDQLLEQPHWAMESMATLTLGGLPRNEMHALNLVYQNATEGSNKDESLVGWFHQIQHWQPRGPKLKALMSSLALELSVSPYGDRSNQMAASLHDLQKLHQFLLIEDHAKIIESNFQLPHDAGLQEVLLILQQPWIYESWISARAETLNIPKPQQQSYFLYLKEMFELLPEGCFEQEVQRHQLMETFEKLTQSPRSSATSIS